jgi:hypothetical protein
MSKTGPIDLTDTSMWGHVYITDKNTGEVLVDQFNSIHFENMSITLANGLAGKATGNIHEMHFGSGGTAISGTGGITYFPSNVTSESADLYNPTYYKVVNDQSSLNTDATKNFIEVRHLLGTNYSDVIVTCTLDYSEPSGQEAFDDTTDITSSYVFDEIGLKTYDASGAGNGRLITHVIFSPVQKSLNRLIEIIYTLRISLV